MALLDPLEVILCVFAWQLEQKKNHDMERVHVHVQDQEQYSK